MLCNRCLQLQPAVDGSLHWPGPAGWPSGGCGECGGCSGCSGQRGAGGDDAAVPVRCRARAGRSHWSLRNPNVQAATLLPRPLGLPLCRPSVLKQRGVSPQHAGLFEAHGFGFEALLLCGELGRWRRHCHCARPSRCTPMHTPDDRMTMPWRLCKATRSSRRSG